MVLAFVAHGLNERALEPTGVCVLVRCVGRLVRYLVCFCCAWELGRPWVWGGHVGVGELCCRLFLYFSILVDAPFKRAMYLREGFAR